MKLFRISTLLTAGFAVLAGTALFLTSQKVQIAESRVHHLKSAVAHEEKTIRVLSAEWDYLDRPGRLEALARETLGMVPAAPGVVASSADVLPDLFMPDLPARKPVRYLQPVTFTPAAPAAPAAERAKQKPAQLAVPEPGRQSFQSLLEDLAEEGQ